MTPEEREQSIETLRNAARIANKFGPMILDDADNFGGTAVTAAAIMLSSFGSAMGMSMHDTMSLVMSVHKQTMNMETEE